jgi:hypothetical protein
MLKSLYVSIFVVTFSLGISDCFYPFLFGFFCRFGLAKVPLSVEKLKENVEKIVFSLRFSPKKANLRPLFHPNRRKGG